MNENTIAVDTASTDAFIRELKARQNLPLAILAGAIASLVGAAVWAGITVATQYQIGYIAIGVGFVVGFAVRKTGHGVTPAFGVVGAIFALLGCVIGNFLSLIGFISIEIEESFFDVLFKIDYSLVPELMTDTFEPIDLLFYALAIYAGYRYSFHKISE